MALRSFTEAEIILTSRWRLERPLLVMIWLGATIFSVTTGSWFYVLAATVATGVNLLAVRRSKEIYISRPFVNVGVILATAVLVLELLSQKVSPLVALGRYLILIQLCKLFERKSNRDYVQMFLLSLLQIVAATLIAQKLWFALVLPVYLALACYASMVFTLKRGLDAAAASRLATESSPIAPRRIAWNVIRNWPRRAVALRTAASVLASLAMGVLVFLAAPRGNQAAVALLGRPAAAAAETSGYSGTVQLGRIDRVYLSDRIVMYVEIEKSPAGKALPENAAYLRGRTMNQYAGSRWSNRQSGSAATRQLPAEVAARVMRAAFGQKVSLHRRHLPTLFASYPAVKAKALSPGKITLTPRGDLRIRLHQGASEPLVKYSVHCLGQPISAFEREYLARPGWADRRPSRPAEGRTRTGRRVVQLARRWCGPLLARRDAAPPGPQRDQLDLAIARRIAEQLRRRYSYTLDLSKADPDRDGVEDFLFHMKAGHCEYFASALTVMCQCLDLRARLATGFHMSEYSRSGNTYVVRDRDAHAWTEVYTPSTHWVLLDANPAARFAAARRGWLARIKDQWQKLQFLWYQKVIGYDSDIRTQLYEWIGTWSLRVGKLVSSATAALKHGFTEFLARGHVTRALGCFAVLVGLLALLAETVLVTRILREGLRARRSARSARIRLAQVRFFLDLLRLLGKHGYERPRGATPREMAAEAAGRLSLPAEILADLVELYYRLRWGRAQVPQAEIAAAEKQVDRLRQALGR